MLREWKENTETKNSNIGSDLELVLLKRKQSKKFSQQLWTPKKQTEGLGWGMGCPGDEY